MAAIHSPAVAKARYAMTETEERDRILLARRIGERLDDRHTMIVGGPKSLAADLGRITEQRIFDGEWSGHSPTMMQDEYGPYDDRSIFVVILDDEGVAAAGRTLWSPDATQPTKAEVDLGIDPVALRAELGLVDSYGSPALWEVATVACEPRARHSEVVGWLLGELRYQELRHHGLAPSVAVVATAFYRLMAAWGIDIEPLPLAEPLEYLGVVSQPAVFAPGDLRGVRSGGPFERLTRGLVSRVQRPIVPVDIDLRVPSTVDVAAPPSELAQPSV